MKYLLDTNIFLWSLDSFQKLNEGAQKVLRGGQDIFLSAASSWEISIKVALGKLNLPKLPSTLIPEAMARLSIQALVISHSHTLALEQLPNHHKDPFDRLLVAQARSEDMTLMTADPLCAKYPVDILWCGK
jgi:PIN domain nuclease of toxin-antitoxin system